MSAAVVSLAEFSARRAVPVRQVEATPMMQQGFIPVPNAVEDALLRSTLTQRQERVFRAVLRKTLGYGKQEDCIATSQLAEMTGLHESHVRQALIDLVDMGMVNRGKRSKFGTLLTPVLSPECWQQRTESVRSQSPSTRTNSVRLPVRSYRISTDKRTDLAPTINNNNIQNYSPLYPPTTTDDAVPAVAPKPKRPSARKAMQTFADWAQAEKAAARKLVPDDDAVFDYADTVGIDRDILRLAWLEFRNRYRDNGKRYADWRQVFRNAVRGNWLKLWYFDNGQCLLTTAGMQAQRAAEAQP